MQQEYCSNGQCPLSRSAIQEPSQRQQLFQLFPHLPVEIVGCRVKAGDGNGVDPLLRALVSSVDEEGRRSREHMFNFLPS